MEGEVVFRTGVERDCSSTFLCLVTGASSKVISRRGCCTVAIGAFLFYVIYLFIYIGGGGGCRSWSDEGRDVMLIRGMKVGREMFGRTRFYDYVLLSRCFSTHLCSIVWEGSARSITGRA